MRRSLEFLDQRRNQMLSGKERNRRRVGKGREDSCNIHECLLYIYVGGGLCVLLYGIFSPRFGFSHTGFISVPTSRSIYNACLV